eukprot:CAMPEP_0194270162 /NCGR_PEP_ID=MMETSP0169-20130528/4207_1 /TAXON_ID=218684 /ORGANISM="Corethron pennatum, Strain L29A3" /LENGTH=80 /DNA_ID=CAMNT_0039012101 /DNA_START=166 /DNA_END=408 /DNA_ORIENTATION=+
MTKADFVDAVVESRSDHESSGVHDEGKTDTAGSSALPHNVECVVGELKSRTRSNIMEQETKETQLNLSGLLVGLLYTQNF